MLILTDICQELRNWFDRYEDKFTGNFVISGGVISGDSEFELKPNQYFRIIGSAFNDGVHKYTQNVEDDNLVDEEFEGVVWAMAVPPSVVALSEEIDAWLEKYGGANGAMRSPYQSESFGGYSYNKASGGSGGESGGGSSGSWQSVFANELNKWRKI